MLNYLSQFFIKIKQLLLNINIIYTAQNAWRLTLKNLSDSHISTKVPWQLPFITCIFTIMKICHKCKKEIAEDFFVGRQLQCPSCEADLHWCLNCSFYDVGAYNDCREPQAERVLWFLQIQINIGISLHILWSVFSLTYKTGFFIVWTSRIRSEGC